ncbi:sensor histidine kinase [Kroppenstedtia pulmonis]|nr:HAMP domain-containing sensor histidine kinase [Kroppenstedtia pulmonis]
MKLGLRIAFHFCLNVCLMFLVMGISLAVIEEIQPLEGKSFNMIPFIALAFFFLFAICYGLYVSWPLRYLIRWIHQLAEGHYNLPPKIGRSYQKNNGKIRRPFHLYHDVMLHMQTLTHTLRQNELEKKRLDELKREWIAGISHDLKTPLTYINGYSTMLLSSQYKWEDEEKEQFSREIQQKTNHLIELIQDLNLSLQMDGEIPLLLSKQNLVEFVRRVVADVANDPQATAYHLEFHSEEEAIEVHVDEKLLKRALQNLLMNAVLHNPQGTHIQVSVHKSDKAQIIISDDGIGMDQETVDHLFVKYYRGTPTDTPSEGTGLGMSIAKQLISAHQGDIQVTSKVNHGTSFSVTIPLEITQPHLNSL